MAGVDMSTSDPIERALTEYDEQLDRMAELV
jgi:oligoendopeptidase F